MTIPMIFVVSGGTGASGGQLVRTALAQFSNAEVQVEVIPQVRSAAQLEDIVAQAVAVNGMIVHTLVDVPLRHELIALAHRRQVIEIDLMGSLLDHLTQRLGRQPLGQPGLYRKQNEQDLKRIEAIEFAVEHDDGKRVHEVALAELVLVGVSRVGKTPLSMYLATLGWKAANIPLIKDIHPPEELFRLDRSRVVGLTMEPGQLVLHRRQRERRMGTPPMPTYAEAQSAAEEIEYARTVFRQGQFRIVDTTDKPIEEAAQEVLNLVRRSRQ